VAADPRYIASTRIPQRTPSQSDRVRASSHSSLERWLPLFRPLLTSKRRPHFKTRNVMERIKIWSWVPREPEATNDCAGETSRNLMDWTENTCPNSIGTDNVDNTASHSYSLITCYTAVTRQWLFLWLHSSRFQQTCHISKYFTTSFLTGEAMCCKITWEYIYEYSADVDLEHRGFINDIRPDRLSKTKNNMVAIAGNAGIRAGHIPCVLSHTNLFGEQQNRKQIVWKICFVRHNIRPTTSSTECTCLYTYSCNTSELE
jgi:hypothetical protein